MRESNKKLFPLIYSIYTRHKSTRNFLATLFYNHIYFIIIITFFSINNMPSIKLCELIIFSLINIFVFLQFYEIGYIINDSISIKLEKRPHKRIDFTLTKRDFIKFILSRTIISLLFFLISIFLGISEEVVLKLAILYSFTQAIFILHNSLKNIYQRIITFSLLRLLKYFTTIFPLWTNLNWQLKSSFIMLIMIYCIYYINGYMRNKDLKHIPFNENLIELYLIIISTTGIFALFNISVEKKVILSFFTTLYFLFFWLSKRTHLFFIKQ